MILVCGEALFDIFLGPASGDDEGSVMLRGLAGGSAFNVAVGLARLGRSVALATQLSDDLLGKSLAKMLTREGVDLTFVRHTSDPTPLALVETGAGGPRYTFHGVREMRLDPAQCPSRDDRITGIHVGSMSVISGRSSERLLDLMADAGGRLVSFDPNVRLAVKPDPGLWRSQVDRFRRYANLVKVSLEDVEAVYGAGCDAEQIVSGWVTGETKIVVLTLGAQGSVLFSCSGRLEIPADPVAVVDTVGAGDTFQAALLCWLGENDIVDAGALGSLSAEKLRSMAAFATSAAALTCSRRGANMPRRAELR